MLNVQVNRAIGVVLELIALTQPIAIERICHEKMLVLITW
jgi:hypothetical protein